MSHLRLSMNESSREALAGDHSQNIDPKITMAIAREVAAVTRLGIEFCEIVVVNVFYKLIFRRSDTRIYFFALVVGGGNIFRGSS
ncbi:hypothetical protein JHK87_043409 [Glycine soja]|nr:hypothetical protein JHK87_043409 [Glycine soja]